jgi:plastocyanin
MKTITVFMVIGTLALAACGSSSSSSSSDAGSAASATTSTPGYGGASNVAKTTTASNPSGSSVTEVMHDDYFGTKTISGKPGAKVTVKLVNQGKNEHNFKIDSQKAVDADVKPGATHTVELTIPKSGSVQFYCEYHKGLGMVGTVKAS